MKAHAVLAVTLPFLITTWCKPVNRYAPTVNIDLGVISGTTKTFYSTSTETTVVQYLGVPFAAPPVRFEPPRRPKPWQGVYDASAYKPTCIQKFDYPEDARNRSIKWFSTPPPPVGESEDCLYLNVYVPAEAVSRAKPKAVMFWIYGGGFDFGSGALPSYDGSSFAANQDVIVVTFNYRTNVFGFPGSPDIPHEQQNLGFLDQRLALDWVHRNIHAFGGDPQRVTIFGESAGAGSVDALITAPPEPIPFSAAIMESGQASIIPPNPSSAISWQRLVVLANCSGIASLECIREVPASSLKNMVERHALKFFPVHDGGVTWADKPRIDRRKSTPENSRIARVPILMGTNADDGSAFVYGALDVKKYLDTVLPPNTPVESINKVLAEYPVGSPGILDANGQLSRIYTDLAFQCPTAVVSAESVAVSIPTWRYYYNASFTNSELFSGSGVAHSTEIGPVFGTYPRHGATSFQKELSAKMQKIWADFAKNPIQGPGWKSVPEVAVLGGGARPGEDDVGRRTVATINARQIDQKCWLYKPLFDLVSLV